MPRKALRLLAAACGLVLTFSTSAAVVFQENFDLGPRLKGNRGDSRNVFANDSIGGYWVQYPMNASDEWIAPDGDANTWNFGAISVDPLEPPLPGQSVPDPSSGMAYGKGIASASAPFVPNATDSYTLNAALLTPNNYVGNPNPGADLLRIGFATSNALADNLANSGVAYVTLRSGGLLELHTATASTSQQLLGFSPTINQLVHLTLTYDRASGMLIADTEHAGPISLPIASFNPQFVGMDVRTPTNEALIGTVSYIQITNVVPEPSVGAALLLGAALTARRRR